MKLFLFIFSLAFLYRGIHAQKLYKLSDNVRPADYLPKTIIIKVKPQYAPGCVIDKIDNSAFNALAAAIGVVNLHKKFPLDKSPEKPVNEAGQKFADLSLIYELNYTSDLFIEKAISKLMMSGILVYAEPHFVPKTTYMPNDPLANATNQYHLQTVNAFGAWSINKGDSSIVIGITDTGTDPTHTDLFNNIKRNYADVVDGIDNDGDGYIDNYMGWDLGVNDNDPTWEGNAHGVHVCGISGASADNSIGGAGVGFNCKFLPVKIGDASGALIAAYEGIKYAADHGCTVINCSWGGGGASQYGQDVIDYATINKNCLVVAAAGNNGADGDFFPGAYNYVLAVANTSSNDVKHSTSDYGYFVDVCAPGDNINSTWPGSFYITLTGTSMSSPLTAGAAGIVKKQFPSYNGLQLGERLKVTADNIVAVNPSYINKLGSGRINLYRALTDPASPSVVFSDKAVTDHNDEIYIVGDTLFITGKFTNYLNPTAALNVTVTPLSSYATVLDNTTSLGIINTLASKTNTADPFTFKLAGSIPINESIDFEVLMQDGSYSARQYFSIFLNVDYIDITINDIYTTATSKGKIGYNLDAQAQGLGFKYKGTDLLYESGLMIGRDTNTVSDCVRGTNVNVADIDFGTMNRISKLLPAVTSNFDTQAKINDVNSIAPIPIEVQQNTYAWSVNPYKQFVIWEYVIKNTHATDTLKTLYAGILADWDIDGSTYGQNRSNYDTAAKMGYSFYTGATAKYAGIKLLTNTAPPNFYAVDNVAGGNGGLDFTNGIDTKEKYKAMSTKRLQAGVGGSGNDIINVMSSGPFHIAPGQTVKVAFAMLGADSLSSLFAAAYKADTVYNGLVIPIHPNAINELKNSEEIGMYPNPAKNEFTITQSGKKYTTLELYNVSGKLIYKQALNEAEEVINVTELSAGVYIIKLGGNDKPLFKKIVLIN